MPDHKAYRAPPLVQDCEEVNETMLNREENTRLVREDLRRPEKASDQKTKNWLTNLLKDISKRFLCILYVVISLWTKGLSGAYMSQIQGKPAKYFPLRIDDFDSLNTNYYCLLQDMEGCEDADFIHAVYKDYTNHKLVVDVTHGRYQDAKVIMEGLPNHSAYQRYLEIVESDPGENLMMQLPSNYTQHKLIGNGSSIAVIDKPEDCLNALLADKSKTSIGQVLQNRKDLKAVNGTLTCISKHFDKFYAITAQHIFNEKNYSLNNMHVISEVKYFSRGLHLADLIHLSSTHFGTIGIIENAQNEMPRKHAVDVALISINQRQLDEGLLKLIPVFTRSTFEALCPNDIKKGLRGKRVKKVGAITGETTGEIINDDCTYEICDGKLGEMFAVAGLGGRTFAEPGDSGALVTIVIEGHEGEINQFALGIVCQRREEMLGRRNVVLCVRLEECLNALVSVEPTLRLSEIQLYRGWLKPAISIRDRREPHQIQYEEHF